MKKHLILPPYSDRCEERYNVYFAMCQLICEIPYGMVAVEKELYSLLESVYGISQSELITPLSDRDAKLGKKYPFWRLLSDRGHLIDLKVLQSEMLAMEGHTVLQPKPNEDRFIVENYKEKLYNFDNLDIYIMDFKSDRIQDAMEYVFKKLNSSEE